MTCLRAWDRMAGNGGVSMIGKTLSHYRVVEKIRASLLGASLVVPFNERKLSLGTWQQIVVIDFDNRPRSRQVILQIMGE